MTGCKDCNGTEWLYNDDDRAYPCPTCEQSRLLDTWSRIAPRRFWEANLDDLTQPEAVKQTLVNWSENINGNNLVLLGPTGAGKTFAAYAVLRDLHLHNWHVAWTSAPMMFESLRPDGGATRATYTVPEILLLDDVGTEKPSEATEQEMFAIIDSRWRNRKATIITSNLQPAELERRVGQRVYDRLLDDAVNLKLLRRSQRRRSA